MPKLIELLKVIFLGIVEGVTEWLPISSTGHMLLVDAFIQMDASEAFKEMFFYVIQLGAILAVVVLFWRKMTPLFRNSEGRLAIRKETISTWCQVIIACIPGGIAAIAFDDWIDAHLHTPLIIAIALIVYGIAFLLIERPDRKEKVAALEDMDYRTALAIGLFQVVSIIPGTSRSGATIVGALLIGVSRVAAAEFTFFLAIPVMLGASLLKVLKFGFVFTSAEAVILAVGCIVSFVVSLFVIKFLMSYIKKHDFKVFGYYRIVLGILVLLYFTILS